MVISNSSFKISILTPSYNSGKYLERAIKSVQAQTYTNWEHIIIDSGSTDKTIEILKKYPHLKWISEPDQGQSDAMNKAFAQATGDLIVYLNADDVFEEGIFEEIAKFFTANKSSQIVVGQLRIVKPKTTTIHTPTTEFLDILNPNHYTFPLNPVSYFYRRAVQESIGNFPINYHYAMDYWFLLEAYWYFKVDCLATVFGTFYFHDSNKSNQSDLTQTELYQVRHQFLKQLLSELSNKVEKMSPRQTALVDYLTPNPIANIFKSSDIAHLWGKERETYLQLLTKKNQDLEKKINWYQQDQARHNRIDFLIRKTGNLLFNRLLKMIGKN